MIRGHKEGCRCDACFELMLEDVRQAQREVAVILGDAPTRSDDAMTRERALEEALRKYGDHLRSCHTFKGGRSCTCGLDAALASAQQEPSPSAEAVEHELRQHIVKLEKWIGELRMCVGCGSTQTIEDIRKDHPAALACCPERKMLTLKEWRQRSDKFEQALTAERQRREECEAVLKRLDVNGDSDIGRKLARVYFSRYPS